MQKLAKCCRRDAKCSWVSEAREKTCQLESVRQGAMEVVASETDIDKLGNIFSNRGELSLFRSPVLLIHIFTSTIVRNSF